MPALNKLMVSSAPGGRPWILQPLLELQGHHALSATVAKCMSAVRQEYFRVGRTALQFFLRTPALTLWIWGTLTS